MKKILWNTLDPAVLETAQKAIQARENAHAPFSHFNVGAAVRSSDGKIYQGCNIESVDFTLTTHAEMCAIDHMIVHGEKKIDLMVIAMQNPGTEAVPCGLCRQKMSQFAHPDLPVFTLNLQKRGDPVVAFFLLSELFPHPFNVFKPSRKS